MWQLSSLGPLPLTTRHEYYPIPYPQQSSEVASHGGWYFTAPKSPENTAHADNMARDDTVRFGIVGCADIARKVARAIGLVPNATLCAIASRSLNKAQTFAAQNKLPDSVAVYGSYDQLLDDPRVDALYLPLPTALHLRWAVAAAARKKHVLVEKPAALDAAELDRILEACESNGVQFMDGSMWLHHPRTAHMQQLLSLSHSGSIGPVRFVSQHFDDIILIIVTFYLVI